MKIYQKSLIFIPDFQTLWLSRMPHKYVINWHTMANQPHSSGQLWKLSNDYANHTPHRSLAHYAIQVMITSVSGRTASSGDSLRWYFVTPYFGHLVFYFMTPRTERFMILNMYQKRGDFRELLSLIFYPL